MTEPTTKLPQSQHPEADSVTNPETGPDPRDLVRTGGYPANIREAVESPMVSPDMPNAPGDLRIDLMDDD